MGKDSAIEWTHHTFNPWWGCQRVSPGCEHCYAETLDKRVGGHHWGAQSERRFFGDKHWNDPLRWNREAEAAGERRRVFCASMADVFEGRSELDPHRARLFAMIAETPALDWLLLTKRPENAERLWVAAHLDAHGDAPGDTWAPNVWIGTTVEDQRRAEERIPHLVKIPAAVRFLSCEPLLGPVDLDGVRLTEPRVGRLDWVIVGGESGPGARRMSADWARSLRDQCALDGVPFFFKQWGEHGATGFREGKRVAGRILDGQTHDAFPGAQR